ncbi:MAG TPA: hypothetical protein VGD71_36960 [Kribbella sp.]
MGFGLGVGVGVGVGVGEGVTDGVSAATGVVGLSLPRLRSATVTPEPTTSTASTTSRNSSPFDVRRGLRRWPEPGGFGIGTGGYCQPGCVPGGGPWYGGRPPCWYGGNGAGGADDQGLL